MTQNLTAVDPPRAADIRAAAVLVARRRAVAGGLDALRAQMRSAEIAEQAGERSTAAQRRFRVAVLDLLAQEAK